MNLALVYTPTHSVNLENCSPCAFSLYYSGCCILFPHDAIRVPVTIVRSVGTTAVVVGSNPLCIQLRHVQVISADVKGFIKYWDSNTFKFPAQGISFKSLFQTDLMECVKAGTTPKAIAVTKSGNRFAIVCSDLSVRVFEFASGKLLHTFNATMQVRCL